MKVLTPFQTCTKEDILRNFSVFIFVHTMEVNGLQCSKYLVAHKKFIQV